MLWYETVCYTPSAENMQSAALCLIILTYMCENWAGLPIFKYLMSNTCIFMLYYFSYNMTKVLTLNECLSLHVIYYVVPPCLLYLTGQLMFNYKKLPTEYITPHSGTTVTGSFLPSVSKSRLAPNKFVLCPSMLCLTIELLFVLYCMSTGFVE